MRAVNLLPSDASSRRGIRDEDPVVLGGAALAAVVVAALGAGFVVSHSHAASEQQRLASARAELGRVSALVQPVVPAQPSKPIVPVPAVTAQEQPRLAALTAALATRIDWDGVLRDFALVVPSDITVSSLSMSAPVAAAAAGANAAPGKSFTLGGTAYSHDSVARLLARLMLIPSLQDVTLTNSTADSGTGRVTFQIDAQIKPNAEIPGPASPAVPSAAASTNAGSAS